MDDNSGIIDEHLPEAYRNTRYWVQIPDIEIQLDQKNEDLDVFLFDNHCWQWAFISAFNPGSQALNTTENEQRHQQLLERIEQLQLRHCEGMGIPAAEEDWLPEKNLLVLDIDRATAVALAREFGQFALLYGQFEGVAELVWTSPG